MTKDNGSDSGPVTRAVAGLLYPPHLCSTCAQDIPYKRLEATKGRATQCVTCLTAQGDVPRVRRFDETIREGIVETMFTENRYVEEQLTKLKNVAPPTEAMEQAVGDDSHLFREPAAPLSAGHISESFEDDLIEEISGDDERLKVSTPHSFNRGGVRSEIMKDVRARKTQKQLWGEAA